MRYFKTNNYIFKATDDLTKCHCIYDLKTKEHVKYPWWYTRPIEWKDRIELTKKEAFIELL